MHTSSSVIRHASELKHKRRALEMRNNTKSFETCPMKPGELMFLEGEECTMKQSINVSEVSQSSFLLALMHHDH